MLLLTEARAAEPVMVGALRQDMEAALGSVAAAEVLGVATVTVLGPVVVAAPGVVTVAVIGVATVAVLGLVVVVAPGLVTVAVIGVATVALLGEGTVTDLTTVGIFLVRVLDSLATVTRGTIRAIPITRTMMTPPMTADTMAIPITVINTTEALILAPPLPSRSKPRSHDVVTIADRLTVCLDRRLAMQFDHFRRIRVCRLPGRLIAG
jgi:hypothetical protein